jgi:predicted DNA-binding protein
MTGEREAQGSEEFEGPALRDAWRRGKPARLVRESPGTSVLSIRVPRDLLKELSTAARAREKTPGTFARELIEDGLAQQESAEPWLIARVLARMLKRLDVDVREPTKPDSWFGLAQEAGVTVYCISWSSGLIPVGTHTLLHEFQRTLVTPERSDLERTGRLGIDQSVSSASE